MSENDSGTADEQKSLKDQPYGDLMNAARSAREQFEEIDIDTNAPTKEELVQSMKQIGFDGNRQDGWTVMVDGDEEEVDLLDVQTPEKNGGSSGPSDKTVLYCLTRKETTPERVEEIREALEGVGYELREAGSGDKFSIVLPVESQDVEIPDEEEDEVETDDEEQEAPEPAEMDLSGQEAVADGAGAIEAVEAPEEEETDESEDEEDESGIKASLVRERLNERNKGDVYDMAVELDIDGRSDMTKEELINAIIEARDDVREDE